MEIANGTSSSSIGAAIDAKQSGFQQIRMGSNESIFEYSHCIDGFVSKLKSAGHHV